MATSTIVTNIQTINGRYYVTFNDGSQREYDSFGAMKAAVQSTDSNLELTKDLDLALWIAKDANGSNTNLIVGKTFTFDLSAASPIKLQ